MMLCHIHDLGPSQAVIRELPPVADGSRFIDTQPIIRQRAQVGVLHQAP